VGDAITERTRLTSLWTRRWACRSSGDPHRRTSQAGSKYHVPTTFCTMADYRPLTARRTRSSTSTAGHRGRTAGIKRNAARLATSRSGIPGFMQFNRDEAESCTPAEALSVATGMALERIAGP